MKKIEQLSDHIKEEIEDAQTYAHEALELKNDDKAIADLYATLANEELKHMQMLQNRYDDERAANVALRNDISNFQQSLYILSQTGRWVAWTGSGSQATPAAA